MRSRERQEDHQRNPVDLAETIELATYIIGSEIRRLKKKSGSKTKDGEALTSEEASTMTQYLKCLVTHQAEIKAAIEGTLTDNFSNLTEKEEVAAMVESVGGVKRLNALLEEIELDRKAERL